MTRTLSEIVIKPKKQKYSRKNNPAVELMKKVIAAKEKSNIERNDFCSYSKYQKITFAFNNITKEFVDSGFLSRFPLMVKQVEFCPQTGKQIMPLTYNETFSEYKYKKAPKQKRENIIGTRSEGFTELFATGDIATVVLQRFFTDVNIYDNSISLLEREFTSPLSDKFAISFYQYYIMDTLVIDNDRCIELSFVPRNPQDFGFSGRLWVLDDGSYNVKRCVLNLPVRSSVNFINNMIIEQNFETLQNGQNVLIEDNMLVELGALKRFHNMMVKRTTVYSDFSFSSIPDSVFENNNKNDENIKDESFWLAHRPIPLTVSEARMPTMMNEISQTRGYGWIVWIVRAFVENYVETSPVGKKNYFDFGPINTVVSSNFIDKVRLRIGGQTTANLHPNLFLGGYIAYGILDKKIKYKGEIEYSFIDKKYSSDEFPRNSISISTQYDVMSPTDALMPRDKDNVFVSMKTQVVDQMIYYRNHNMKYEYEFENHFGITAQIRHMTQTPTGSLYYKTVTGKDIGELVQSEFSLGLRYAPGESFVITKQKRHAVNNNNPIYTFTYTSGFKDVLGSDYFSNYTEISLYKRFWLNSFGRIDLFTKAGAQWNRVPFPLLIAPAANNSYIITKNMFSMINNMEFMNDRFVSLDLQWDMNGKILNRIPLIKHLKWREIFGFKLLYGTLTDKNNPYLNLDSDKLYMFPSRNGEPTTFTMGNKPYMEFNVGLHNIFKILRIDYVRRLNYLNLPNVQKNGIRIALEFDF